MTRWVEGIPSLTCEEGLPRCGIQDSPPPAPPSPRLSAHHFARRPTNVVSLGLQRGGACYVSRSKDANFQSCALY
jgi:hypothetical protein